MHRFAPAAYYLIGLMDGQRTVQEMWELASAHLGDDAPTQDEVIQFLTQLHAADVLQCDVPPDTTELLLRYDRQQRQTWQSQLLSPLFWRFPVCDPERFLRIHRSTIVNIERIREIQPLFHGDYVVLLRDGTELTLSRTYRQRVQEVLGASL